MKYYVFDQHAAQRVVEAAELQSHEYSQAAAFLNSLMDNGEVGRFSLNVEMHKTKNGIYILEPKAGKAGTYIIFDLEQADIRSDDRRKMLAGLQKCLRYAIKYWSNRPLSSSEKRIPGTTKVVVFPFPISTKDGYRLTIEMSIANRRIEKRYSSKNLLVYQHGYDAGNGAEHVPNTRNAELALSGLSELNQATLCYSGVAILSDGKARDGIIDVTHVEPPAYGILSLTYDAWLTKLTDSQRKYVTTTSPGVSIIEGAAGTGKTLCLVLKTIHDARQSAERGDKKRSIFVAHSEATMRAIDKMFDECHGITEWNENHPEQSINVTTLQRWCGEILGEKVFASGQYLDIDALSSKEMRKMIIEDCLAHIDEHEWSTYAKLLSDECCAYFRNENREYIADMLQHEIGVVIKGMAGEDVKRYLKLPNLSHNIPIQNDHDKRFIYNIYMKYNNELQKTNEYDTDDVVITALAHLDTPYWRRVRVSKGYDSITVDETHLFNFNELSVIHKMASNPGSETISFSMDRTQASGDRGVSSEMLRKTLHGDADGVDSNDVTVRSVFRSSPEIVQLASSITASGATLFVGFHDPLQDSDSAFTYKEEQKSATPLVRLYKGDEDMIVDSYRRHEKVADELECSRSNVAIIAFCRTLYDALVRHARSCKKAITCIETRGDMIKYMEAQRNHSTVVALADYVGGLEFDGCILVGVDKGRLPNYADDALIPSRHYLEYKAHNLLYVAVTRAKYRVEMLVNESRGISSLLEMPISKGVAVRDQLS